MRAMVVTDYKASLEMAELPDPEPPPGGAVIRVLAAGVCHSDLHLVSGQPAMIPTFPWVLGHEVVGEVVALGAGARAAEVGDHVAVFGGWGCGHCSVCHSGDEQLCDLGRWLGIGVPGGYAEYVAVPATRHLLPLHGLDPVEAAPLTDAGLTPYRAVAKVLPRLHPGSVVVSIGAGGLGQYGLQYVKTLSAARVLVADTAADKLDRARELGADAVVDPARDDVAEVVAAMTDGAGAAAVIDYVGSDVTLATARATVGKQGTVVIVGLSGGHLPVGFLDLPVEATVTTSYWGNRIELSGVLTLAREGRVTGSQHTYPLAQAQEALDDLREGRIAGRAVLVP